MEQMLLQLDLDNADDEELNAIFRCAHSIKGGAATFGFADVAELTHQMESLLDKLRRHELQPTAPMVDVLLESSDALRSLLARHQGKSVDTPATAILVSASATWPRTRHQRAAVARATGRQCPHLHPRWPSRTAPAPAAAQRRSPPRQRRAAARHPDRSPGQPGAGRQHRRPVPRHHRPGQHRARPATRPTSASTGCTPAPATPT